MCAVLVGSLDGARGRAVAVLVLLLRGSGAVLVVVGLWQDVTRLLSLSLTFLPSAKPHGQHVVIHMRRRRRRRRRRENRFHLSLHQTILLPFNSFLDFGFPGL